MTLVLHQPKLFIMITRDKLTGIIDVWKILCLKSKYRVAALQTKIFEKVNYMALKAANGRREGTLGYLLH